MSGNNYGGSSSNALVIAKDYSEETISDRANQRRQEQYRQVRAHVQKEDGRLHAYGWSLPGTKTNPTGISKNDRKLPKVPAPVYCSPLAEASPHMKVFCAAGVNLNGGYTKDGGCVVSIYFIKCNKILMHTQKVFPNSSIAYLVKTTTIYLKS